MLLIPMIFSTLDDEQVESILTLLESLVEARDKDVHRRIAAFVEMFSEEFGNGTPEELSQLAQRVSDPEYFAKLQQKADERLKAQM